MTRAPVLWEMGDDETDDERVSLLGRRRRERGATRNDEAFGQRRLQHRRVIFTYLLALAQVGLLVAALVLNGGIEPFATNPFIGPSTAVLLTLGAKDVAAIRRGQIYRLWTPGLLNAGVVQLVLSLSWQLRFGRAVEQRLGCWRVALVWLVGVAGGTLMSSLFLPDEASVGAASAMLALLGCQLAELALMARLASPTPCRDAAFVLFSILVTLVVGLLPYSDNFANLGSLLFGWCVAPRCSANAKTNDAKIMFLVSAVGSLRFSSPSRRRRRYWRRDARASAASSASRSSSSAWRR